RLGPQHPGARDHLGCGARLRVDRREREGPVHLRTGPGERAARGGRPAHPAREEHAPDWPRRRPERAHPARHRVIRAGEDGGAPAVRAQRTLLTQVLTSLLANALHAIREHPRDMHRLRVGLRADDEVVTITVEDTGPGIAHEALERIFDPFVTSPRDAAGAGLS